MIMPIIACMFLLVLKSQWCDPMGVLDKIGVVGDHSWQVDASGSEMS